MTSTPNFTHDPYDAEWENPNTGRTASCGSDDYCDDCGDEIDFSIGDADGVCSCPAHAAWLFGDSEQSHEARVS